MSPKLTRCFFISTGFLLILTGSAKLLSSFGNARILDVKDSIFALQFRYIFQMVGLVELVIALFCIFSKKINLQSGLVACFATCVLIYRCGLLWVGYNKPCACLGNLTDAVHIPPKIADTAMKIILVYLFIGSYAILFCLWQQRKRTPTSALL
jgi:hypothetical protein